MKVFGFLILLFSSSSFWGQDVTVRSHEHVPAKEKILHYYGEHNDWSPSNVLSHLDEFEIVKTEITAKLPSDEIDWIFFNLNNPDSNQLWIDLGSDRLNKIIVFRLSDENEVIDSLVSGFDQGVDYRPWGEFKFWLPLLEQNESKGRFLIGFYTNQQSHEFRASFGSKAIIFENSRYDYTYAMIYTGIMLIMIFYNSILAYTLRDKIYVFYSLNLIVVYFAISYGAHFPTISFFLGETFSHNFTALWLSSLFIFMTLFTNVYFDLKTSAPKWYKTLLVISYLSIFNGFLFLILPCYFSSTIFMVLLVTLYAICTVIGIDQIIKKHPLAKLYVLAWVIVFLCTTVYFIVTQLGLFYNDLFYYANYVSSSLEAAIFSIALGLRYRLIMDKEKETAKLLAIKNDALVLSNKSLDSFNYHVSHDLKSVLVNTGSLNKMIKKYAEKENKEKVITISDKLSLVIDKGQDTIQGFLSLGKSLTRTDQSIERLNIKQEILDIISENGLEVVDIHFENSDFEFLNINKTAFESIFLNLLTNSIKYSRQKPIVTIQLKKMDNNIQIIYSDNGVGIDLTKHEDDLFSPFKRVENDLGQEGSGIGLYLVKRIITNYEGTITPYSMPNQGLTFTITFPELMMVK